MIERHLLQKDASYFMEVRAVKKFAKKVAVKMAIAAVIMVMQAVEKRATKK